MKNSLSYQGAFKAINDLMPHYDNRTEKDAVIHRYFIKHGKEEHAKLSFRAVCSHIKAEMALKSIDPVYTRTFSHKGWCQRILKGQTI